MITEWLMYFSMALEVQHYVLLHVCAESHPVNPTDGLWIPGQLC